MAPEVKSDQAAAALCGPYLQALQGNIDEEGIRAALEGVKFSTLNDLAKAFGMSPNTVKQSWRGDGMPGGQDDWGAAEILIWRAIRIVQSRKSSAMSSLTDRELKRQYQEEEVEKLRLQNRKLSREEGEAEGRLIQLDDALHLISAAATVAVETVNTRVSQMETRLPEHIAKATIAEILGVVNRAFTAFAETSKRKILQIARKAD